MPAPLTPETLVYGFTAASDPQLSPDGARVAFVLSQVDRASKRAASQVWVCGIDGANPRRLTWAGERNRGPRWSPDGRTLAFVSDRVPGSGLFVLPLAEGGEARELARHPGRIADPAWSPDGRTIAFVAPFDPDNPSGERRPEGAPPAVRVTRRIDYKQDNQGYLGDERHQVFLADVASGSARRLTSDLVDHEYPAWSPDGRFIACQVPNHNAMHTQLGIVAMESGETSLVGPEEGVVTTWAWSPDGRRIVFTGDTKQTWQTDFFVYHTTSGEVRRVTDDLQVLPAGGFRLVEPPSQPAWLDDRAVLFHATRAGASGLYTIDVESGDLRELHRWRALNVGLSVDAARRYCVQASGSLEAPGEIAVFDRAAGEGRLVTRYGGSTLGEAPAARWEAFPVERDGITIDVWLLFPSEFDPARRYPLVLDVHGGPNGFYGFAFNAMQQCLATHGFLVCYCNPRGSSSYGRQFTLEVVRDWGGEDYRDLMAVLDRVVQRPYVDDNRLGIWGYSYGGYMTAWAIGQSDRFRAAVCGAPCFNLAAMYGTSDIGHTFGKLQWGAPPHEDPAWYAAHSPSSFAHRARTPTLIVHGEADERCPIGQGEEMFIALKDAGCEVEFARYPGGSHLFARVGPPQHREDLLARVLDWFQRHLGGPQ